MNPYSYVANNPINRIDPTGMAWIPPNTLSRGPDYFLFSIPGTEDDEDIFFDTRSKSEIVIDAIIAAINALDEMQANYGTAQDKTDWAAMAQWLTDILDPNNQQSLYMVNPLLLSDAHFGMNPNAVASVGFIPGASALDYAGAHLYVNENYVSTDRPPEFLTSYIIQEAAQVVFAQQHPLSEFGIMSRDELREPFTDNAKRYIEASENYGWRHQITYMDKYVDTSSRSKYPSAAGWYSTIDSYRKYGFDKTWREILEEYYPGIGP